MMKWTRFVLAGAGLLAVVAASDAALAQDNFDAGKSGAQLFASDCAICHKSAQGINRNVGGPLGGLESFLREHYTASREAAAEITAYLNSVGKGPAAAPRSGKAKRKASDEKKDAKPAKTEENKAKKPEEKSGDKPAAKPADKPADKKSRKDKKDSSGTKPAKSAALAGTAPQG